MVKHNEEAREAWSANAAFWDSRMADGNAFFGELVWPAVERLLAPGPGERVLDVACGNGVTSRRLAARGARVTAFDFSAEMIAHARARGGSTPLSWNGHFSELPAALVLRLRVS